MTEELITEARDMALYARAHKHGAVSHADMIDRLADVLEAATIETEWQYSYVEKWADGSGVYERVTFKTEGEALERLTANVAYVSGFNSEQTEPSDKLVALVERRQVGVPGPWEPVGGESTGTAAE